MSEVDDKIEACFNRYSNDCRNIEDQQDTVKAQRRFFQELESQIYFDSRRTYDLLINCIDTNDMTMYQKAAACQEQIIRGQARVADYFSQYQDDLNLEKRKLDEKYEERERLFKEEFRNLTQKKPSPEEDQNRWG